MGQIRATSLTHPGYKLDATDRNILGSMSAMGLWSKQKLADTFGVTRKTVLVCEERWRASIETSSLAKTNGGDLQRGVNGYHG